MPASDYITRIREKIGHELLLLPSVTAIILSEKGHVLLQRASDDGKWHTVGGGIEPGEQPAAAVAREVKEETGLDVIAERITGVYTRPPISYSNGDKCEYVSIAFLCRITGAELRVSDAESLELRFFPKDGLPSLEKEDLLTLSDAFESNEHAAFQK